MRRPDVGGLLSELTVSQIDWWRAAYEAVPLGDSWREADAVAGSVQDFCERYFAMKAGEKPDPKRMHKDGDFIPALKVRKRSQIHVDESSIRAHERNTEQQY